MAKRKGTGNGTKRPKAPGKKSKLTLRSPKK